MNKSPVQHKISTFHEIRGNLITDGFAKEQPETFTVDIGTTVSIVRADVVNNFYPALCSSTRQTGTRSFVKALGKFNIQLGHFKYLLART